jgi:hypothetical protein
VLINTYKFGKLVILISQKAKAKAPIAKYESASSQFSLPLPNHTGNPIPESESTRQGEKQES